MNLYVYSRGMIELIKPYDEPNAIVSIVTPPGDNDIPKLPINADSTKGVLRLVFLDRDVATELNPEIFTVEHARQVWDFVLACQKEGVETFLFHCDAGQCRSPAIAAAISKVMTGDDSEFFRRYRPNMLVFRTLLETWYSDYDGASV